MWGSLIRRVRVHGEQSGSNGSVDGCGFHEDSDVMELPRMKIVRSRIWKSNISKVDLMKG